ncbi:hypothetical protein COV19_06300 [Candidatus Woesearchaeota archaeon CG10_big_fil_rev_8_21_14_0_10_44_13]|nr:MAG: hypothetical protein COV19_06300 [Candidatus Woesearchaeota archaeon CG10_big_fil_rev_8_21_14_0_10_44_13]
MAHIVDMTKKPAFLVIFLIISLLSSAACLAFSNIIWMEQGQIVRTISIRDGIATVHSVKLLDVSGEQSKMCGFLVDNETVWVKEDSDVKVGDVRIYAREVVRVHQQLKDRDICRVIIGGAILSIGEEMNASANKSSENKIMIETESNYSEGGITMENLSIPVQTAEKNYESPEKGFFARIADKIRLMLKIS